MSSPESFLLRNGPRLLGLVLKLAVRVGLDCDAAELVFQQACIGFLKSSRGVHPGHFVPLFLDSVIEAIRAKEGSIMLAIKRKAGQSVFIGEGIVITVGPTVGGSTRLWIQAPSETKISREELVPPRERAQKLREVASRLAMVHGS